MIKTELRELNSYDVMAMEKRYSIDLLTASVLSARGIGPGSAEIPFIIEKDLIYQYSPFEAADMIDAVDRINDAIESDESIIVFGDRDADGITATSIMVIGLRKLGAKNVSWRVPEGDEGYGLTEDAAKQIIESGHTLVITVDCGITAVKEIEMLNDNGIDTIVTDHHIPGETLPPAVAILDPVVEGSGFRFTGLAGCAVAAKLVWALFFSRTPLYGSDIILLHAEPRNGTIRIAASRLENLVEIDRICEEVVEGEMSALRTGLLDFLAVGRPVFVLDERAERSGLRRAFGKNVDIELIDIRDKLDMVIPRAKGKSLFDLAAISHQAMYSDGDRETECLVSLFKSISMYEYKELTTDFDEFLQLAAIGTVADLMPIKSENRIIVKRGLSSLQNRPLPRVLPLLTKRNLIGKPILASDISFMLAPPINAAGRMGKASIAVNMFLSESETEADGFAETLVMFNKQRQDAERQVFESVKEKIFFSAERNAGKIIVLFDEQIPRGLTGTLANRVLKEYDCPAIILADNGEKISGSMRSEEGIDSRSFIGRFADILLDYGGHRMAAGFSLERDRLDEFIKRAEESSSILDGLKNESKILIDAEIPPSKVGDNIWELSEILGPFGRENDELKILIKGAVIHSIRSTSGDTEMMKFTLKCGAEAWPAIWWKPHNRKSFAVGGIVNAVFTPETNWWRGVGTRQMNIVDMELC